MAASEDEAVGRYSLMRTAAGVLGNLADSEAGEMVLGVVCNIF
jgi:hypothetical protein